MAGFIIFVRQAVEGSLPNRSSITGIEDNGVVVPAAVLSGEAGRDNVALLIYGDSMGFIILPGGAVQ